MLSVTKRRLLIGAAALVCVVLAVAMAARFALTTMVANSLLRLAGASEIKFTVTRASPWHVVVEDVGFQVKAQSFTARRVSFTRAHWWTPSLGTIQVDQARVPLTIGPPIPVRPVPVASEPPAPSPVQIPAEKISIDGQLVVQADGVREQALAVKFEVRLTAQNIWEGAGSAAGPGLDIKADGRFDPATRELAVRLPEVALDLKSWQDFGRRLLPLPAGEWEMEGKLTGSGQGRWTGKTLAAGGTVRLREGRLKNAGKAVAAEGVEADVVFTGFDPFATKPGTLRVSKLTVGPVAMTDIDAEFALADVNTVVVSRAVLKAMSGTIAAEPFKYFLSRRELDVVLLADNISVEEVMALTKDLPAKASGRVDGRLPVHIDEGGLRLGTGWLALKPGVYAQVQLNAAGLLTSGVSAKSPSYPVLKKIEAGLLQLKLGELRLDIRPPDAPAGRSAQLHIAGEPVDPTVKAPVILDLNVNGPLEKLLNMGMDSRLNFGGKP